MKANELRIGNLVYADWVDAGRKIETNYGVHWFKDTMVMNVEQTGYGININAVQPIPLTEEWLIKFGFKLKTKHDYQKGWVWIRPNMNGFWYFTALGGDITIQYVHQLQNLYHALTNEEL